MSFDVEIGLSSRKGTRPVNEDFAACARPPAWDQALGLVAAIADGVSTGGAGREAAQTTVLGIVSDFHSAPQTWDISVVLDRLIGAQNAWLVDHNRRRQAPSRVAPQPSAIGMTTLTALVLRSQAWTLAHVGDTRAWLLRDGVCSQLTQDHAFDEEFQRSRLTRAIGLDDPVRVDFEQGELRRGDVFVLTSDGVHGVLPRARIAELVAAERPSDAPMSAEPAAVDSDSADGRAQTASDALVQAALAAGSRDNVTAVVVRVRQLNAGRFEDALLPGRELPVPRRLAAGDELDGHRLLALVADNGMNRVFHARSPLGDEVLLKTLCESNDQDAGARAMLVHEAWLAQRVAERHPPRGEARLVCTRSTAQASALYVVFDWHAGATLEQMLAAGRRFAVADVVDATLAFARALARLHRAGVVHRDIKPSNLHLGDDGVWRLLDLGAAVSGSDSPSIRSRAAGTPSYMNREQWGVDGGDPTPADEASDVYALGVTCYQWLTTKLPYGDVEPYQVGRFRRDPRPPSRLRPEVPIWLDHVVLKAVALERGRRFDTAEELILALKRGSDRPLGRPPATPLLARDSTILWKSALAASLLFNLLLTYWLLFLPR